MKAIFLTSYSDNNLEVFNLSLKNHENYCKQFGYDLVNFKEPYTPHIDIPRIVDFFNNGYDLVVIFGTDIIIKKHIPITNYVKQEGFTMCREVVTNIFNGDFIIMDKSKTTEDILNILYKIQHYWGSTQQTIRCNPQYISINNAPTLQIAAPIMNQWINYSHLNLDDYFSLHYHTINKSPVVKLKETAMKHDLGVQ